METAKGKNVLFMSGVVMALMRGRMNGVAAFLISVLFSTIVSRTQTQVTDLVTDRPDQTESSETVPPGYVQFEFGWTHTEEDGHGDVTSDAFPETLVRVGVASHLELRFGFDGSVWEDADGIGTDDGARSQRGPQMEAVGGIRLATPDSSAGRHEPANGRNALFKRAVRSLGVKACHLAPGMRPRLL
jgi:hypothetical protein